MILRQPGLKPNEFRLLLQPNASLQRHHAWVLIALVGMLLMIIGTGFALIGVWLVLPFSGGELALLAYALFSSMKASARCEIITVSPNKIKVEKLAPEWIQRIEYVKAWVRVDWVPAKIKGGESRLFIGSHGKMVEIGSFLRGEEKRVLADTLQH